MKANLSNSIKENIKRLTEKIYEAALEANRNPKEITLMAVTKTVPAEDVNIAIANGITLLGESKAQELEQKYHQYSDTGVDIHFIGHLQSNKVRQIVPKVSTIHSVDRVSLLAEIDKRAKAIDKTMDILLQVNIGNEKSKSGILAKDVVAFAENFVFFNNIKLRGLMSIPPIAKTITEQEHYFSEMQRLLVDIQQKNKDNGNIDILSMGMSADLTSAIKHGATIVRIGTAIFGNR